MYLGLTVNELYMIFSFCIFGSVFTLVVYILRSRDSTMIPHCDYHWRNSSYLLDWGKAGEMVVSYRVREPFKMQYSSRKKFRSRLKENGTFDDKVTEVRRSQTGWTGDRGPGLGIEGRLHWPGSLMQCQAKVIDLAEVSEAKDEAPVHKVKSIIMNFSSSQLARISLAEFVSKLILI